MSWVDRLKEAAYNTPSGARLLFLYENVAIEFERRATAFNFTDANGTYVQDHGNTGRRIPMRLFFSGADYDLEVAEFEKGLAEVGPGRLEHPMYGIIDVVPFGVIRRRDDLKTAGNQAIVEVTFFETIGLLFPTAQTDPAAQVLEGIEFFNEAVALQFEQDLDIDKVGEEANFKTRYSQLLTAAETALSPIADTQADVQKLFDATYDSINAGIDTLIGGPLTLAFQTSIFLEAPARALLDITARLEAYGNLTRSLLGTVEEPSGDSQNANNFHSADLYATTLVTGAALSTVNNQFETKPDAVSAAEVLLDLLSEVTAWRDANYESLALIDTGEAYQQLQNLIALAAGFLVEISFSLKQERFIVLDRARTIVDLEAELYGTVGENLDFLIRSNDLTGSEILELPREKEIVYYTK